ncbi:hypothetical protein AB0I81_49570 [Nonomuraea sp. NPDC050404]|uniref:hypothetical protein n=1 Tax=Nonomuraea sp. NPDC050404 TaxID=3155783 RepID=UPI0033D396E8
MLIAVAVLAAAVVGTVAWWLRRSPAGGDASGAPGADDFEAEPARGWELPLTPEGRAAFMEGLRAYHEAGDAVRVDEEHGVLTTYEPPRLISLHLLADAFAARGDAALHDPQGTVATLMERLAAAERPGVLHLRARWLEGEVDGLDAARFAKTVGDAVRSGGWTTEAHLGALQVAVPGTGPSEEPRTASTNNSGEEPGAALVAESGDEGRGTGLTHVNGTPIKALARGGDEGDAAERVVVVGGTADKDTAPGEGAADKGTALGGDTAGGVTATADATADAAGDAAVEDATARKPVAGESAVGESAVGESRAGEINTMMVDLGRVLDLYRVAREERPDDDAETLLRQVVPRFIAAGGPGLTWTKPPTPQELRTVLGDSLELL